METTTEKGWKSPKYGNKGLYILCSGPDPNGPRPGERIKLVLLNAQGREIRRIEQVKGNCLDKGYVDFFNSPKCRPSIYEYSFLETDSQGNKTILATHTDPHIAGNWLKNNIGEWVNTHSTQN